LIPIAV